MNKVEIFNKGAALILAKLYEEFPTPIILDVTKLDTGVTEEDAGVYADTVSFLRNENFIRSGNSVNQGKKTSNVVLTSKGLAVLNSSPEVLQVKAPLGERVKEVAKSGSKEVLSAIMQAVIGAVVGNI
jgi:hypothetical protein